MKLSNFVKIITMVLTNKKEVLKEIIEKADEKLMSLMIALANEYNDSEQEYSEQEIAFFEKRRQAFFDGNKEGSAIEEVNEKIRRNYKNGL
jgi:cob(I)alamin adenosyltransferase